MGRGPICARGQSPRQRVAGPSLPRAGSRGPRVSAGPTAALREPGERGGARGVERGDGVPAAARGRAGSLACLWPVRPRRRGVGVCLLTGEGRAAGSRRAPPNRGRGRGGADSCRGRRGPAGRGVACVGAEVSESLWFPVSGASEEGGDDDGDPGDGSGGGGGGGRGGRRGRGRGGR